MLHIVGSKSMEYNRLKLMEEYRNRSDKSRTAYIIVPEQATLVMDAWLMEHTQEQCLMDIRVVSFEKLSEEVLAVTKGRKRPFIDVTGKAMLLRTVFEDYRDEFGVFRIGAQNRGFLTHTLRLLTELKRSEISYERLEETAAAYEGSAVFAQKIKEVSFLQRKMEEKLSGTYCDNEDRMHLLAEGLPQAEFLRSVDFYFTYFNGFTGVEYEVIRSLIRLKGEVWISLPLDETLKGEGMENVFSTSESTLAKLYEIANLEHIEVDFQYEKGVFKKEEMTLLTESLFSFSRPVYPKSSEMLYLRVCETLEEELHLTARTIKQLIMYEKARYRDIGILVTDSAEYFKQIVRVFSLYDIPVFTDEKRELSCSPAIASILSLLDCVSKNLAYEDLFRFLKYGFTDFTRREIDVLEDYVSTHKLRGTMYFDKKYFERGRLEDDERAEVFEICQKLKNLLEGFYLDTRKKHSVKEFSEKLILFLSGIDFPNRIEHYIGELRQAELSDFASENEQVWDLFIDVVDQMVELVGERKVMIREFKEILSAGIEGHKIGIIPPAQDQVVIGTLDRSRNKRSDYLFVLGLCEGYFPKNRAEISLLTQEEREKLDEKGISLPSLSKKIQAEERLNFYLNTSSVDRELHISCPLSDSNGKPLRPSYYMLKLQEMFPKCRVQIKESFDEYSVYSKKQLIRNMAEQLRDAVQNVEDTSPFWKESLAYLMEEDGESTQKMIRALEKKRPARYIGSNYVTRLYGDRISFSSSRLEQFAKCPYRHFIQYGLSPKEKKNYDMEATDIGTLLHESIDSFTSRLKNDPDLVRDLELSYRDDEMEEIFRKKAGDMLGTEFENNARNRYLIEKLKRTSCAVGKHLFRQMQAGEFAIWGQEVDFGYRKELPAVELIKDKAYLRGRIDRIDVLNKETDLYVKIIDYKTSKKRFSLSDAWNGLDIQLLIYLFSAIYSKGLGEKTAVPAGVFYFPAVNSMIRAEDEEQRRRAENEKWLMRGIALKDEDILRAIDKTIEEYPSVFYGNGRKKYDEKDNLLTQQEFERLITHVVSLAQTMAKEILQGKIEVLPVYQKQEDTACNYCRYQSICRFDERVGDPYRMVGEKKDNEVKLLLSEDDGRGSKNE